MKYSCVFMYLSLVVGSGFSQQLNELKGVGHGVAAVAPLWKSTDLATFDESALQVQEDSGGSRFVVFRVEKEGAQAVRLHFSNVRIPASARLFVYSPDGSQIRGPYAGRGDSSDFWSESVKGSTAVVELQWKDDVDALPFTISDVAADSPSDDAAVAAPEAEERVGYFRGVAIRYREVDGYAVVEGDMVIGRAEEVSPAPAGVKAGRDASMIAFPSARWANGAIPYTIDAASNYSAFELGKINEAIAHWNTKLAGSIKLVQRTSESNWVRFFRGGGCYSTVGFANWGQQDISIGNGCFSGQAIHEIGHAVGLFHEQMRNDRDTKVKILWENIQAGKEGNFDKAGSWGADIGTYDYGSIMHYSSGAFSRNGLPTIETIPAGIGIGQRSSLSDKDIAAVRQVYGVTLPPPPPAVTNVTVTVTSNPAGRTITVDGASFVAPKTFTWAVGSSHTVLASTVTAGTTRYRFASWSDGGAQQHNYVAPSANATLTANFATDYKLTTQVTPAGGGTISVAPQSADGFYATGTAVMVTVTPANGNCLVTWSGVLNQPAKSTLSLAMDKAYAVGANVSPGAVTLRPSSVVGPKRAFSFLASISITSGCGWTAKSNASWIGVASAGGVGSASNRISVAVNNTGAQRTGTVSVNNATMTITQNK